MEDLINRQTIIDGLEFVIEHGIETYGAHSISAEKMLEFVRELPTVQPEIVRCEECKYHHQKNCPIEKYFSLDGFCSRGKRREVTT